MAGGRSPPHDVVLVGPRGNGKTALLNWFEDACRKVRVNVARPAPSRVRTERALFDALLPATGLGRLLPATWGVTGVGKAEWVASPPSAQALVERLIARCRRKPTAVLLDEAHTLDVEVGQVLLNASQDVRAAAPFLLVLAGTPGLLAHLGKMNASFWDRLGSGLLGIGRLSNAAAKEALVEPLAAHGASIDADALDAAVAHSQCYAYFIQLWGEGLWNQRLATGETRLTAAHAAAARPSVEARVTEYCQCRHRELEAGGRCCRRPRPWRPCSRPARTPPPPTGTSTPLSPPPPAWALPAAWRPAMRWTGSATSGARRGTVMMALASGQVRAGRPHRPARAGCILQL